MGLAFICYGREEEADGMIQRMTRDQDPILRCCCLWLASGVQQLSLGARCLLGQPQPGWNRCGTGTACSPSQPRWMSAVGGGIGPPLVHLQVACHTRRACLAVNPARRQYTAFSYIETCVCRYGGIYAIGMAYRGTANNAAIQKLLHFAVGDVSDDVRRAAVLALGFVLMNVPEQCPRIVSLLSESYNPHVRYGEPPVAAVLSSPASQA